MIAWLSDWLSQIILVILLATFVELILPSSMMQKYVRVVLSLLILMTLLHPVISLIQVEPDLKQWNMSLEQTKYIPNSQSLAAIMKEGERLRLKNEYNTQQIVEERIQSMMKQSIEQTWPNGVSRINVQISTDDEGESLIKQVNVVLRAIKEQQAFSPSASTVKPMEPVLPVSIHIGLNKQGTAEKEAITDKKTQADGLDERRKSVYALITQEWQLSAGQLQVVYEDR